MAERYLKSINTENILFIVDRNEEKTGREILGKKIFYIDKLEDVDFSLDDIGVLITPQDKYSICMQLAQNITIESLYYLDENIQVQPLRHYKIVWDVWNQYRDNLQLDVLKEHR